MKRMLFITLVIMALVSCGMDFPSTGETTGLKVNFNPTTSRSLIPGISMDCASYQVTISDSTPTIIYDEVVSDSVALSGLLPDSYTVDVIGLNDTLIAIGDGSGSGSVTIGETTTISITINEFTGTGTLDLTTSWLCTLPCGAFSFTKELSSIEHSKAR